MLEVGLVARQRPAWLGLFLSAALNSRVDADVGSCITSSSASLHDWEQYGPPSVCRSQTKQKSRVHSVVMMGVLRIGQG